MPTYNIVNPAESLQTVKPMSIGEMINIGQGMQQYQAGQLQLQQQQREAGERQPLADFMANQSNYMDEQGNIDLNKASNIFKIAPNLGADAYGKMVTLANNQTIANQAKVNLNQDILSGFGNVFLAAANSGYNKQQTITAVQNYYNNLGIPDAKRLGDAYIGTLSIVPEDQNFGQALRQTAAGFMPQETQQNLYGPNVSTVETPAGIVPMVTQRTFGGGVNISSTGEPVITNPWKQVGFTVNGEPIYEGYDPATKRIVKTLIPPTGTQQPVVPYKAPSAAESQNIEQGGTYLTETTQARSNVQPATNALNNIDVITQYLPNAFVGGSAAAAAKQALSKQFGGLLSGTNEIEQAAAAREIVQKNIAGLVAQANAAGNGKLAADLQQQSEALASAEKSPSAIYSSLNQLRPLLLHTRYYSKGLDAAIAKNPQQAHLIKPQFDSAMNDAYSPVVAGLYERFEKLGGQKLLDPRFNKPEKIKENTQKINAEFQKYANQNHLQQSQIDDAKGRFFKYVNLVNGIIK